MKMNHLISHLPAVLYGVGCASFVLYLLVMLWQGPSATALALAAVGFPILALVGALIRD